MNPLRKPHPFAVQNKTITFVITSRPTSFNLPPKVAGTKIELHIKNDDDDGDDERSGTCFRRFGAPSP